jgi:cytochrome P450
MEVFSQSLVGKFFDSIQLKSKHDVSYDICIKKSKSFEKPIEDYTLVDAYGPNVLTSIGDVWKHQRMLFNPIFSQDVYLKFVCNSTVRFTNELIDSLLSKDVNEIKLKWEFFF